MNLAKVPNLEIDESGFYSCDGCCFQRPEATKNPYESNCLMTKDIEQEYGKCYIPDFIIFKIVKIRKV